MADYSAAYEGTGFEKGIHSFRNPTITELQKRIKELEAKVEALTPKTRYKVWVFVDATNPAKAIEKAKELDAWKVEVSDTSG